MEMLMLYELRAGERFDIETAFSKYKIRLCHSSVSTVPFEPSTEFWRFCRLVVGMFEALEHLPAGFGRFGGNHHRF